jgi:hypothetical protein
MFLRDTQDIDNELKVVSQHHQPPWVVTEIRCVGIEEIKEECLGWLLIYEKNSKIQDGVRVQVNQLDLIKLKKVAK